MDILLIATRCKRKPWYLTRSDVFENQVFKPLFEFLQMLPVYRLRDGKNNLSKNRAIFERCGQLLYDGEAILLFPEANHSLKRRVRPLSKGFTRIIEAAWANGTKLDLQLVPIGQNYQNPTKAGDSAALYFGKAISIQEFKDLKDFTSQIKQTVFDELRSLTTHIEEENYEATLTKLESSNVDFTRPELIKEQLARNKFDHKPNLGAKGRRVTRRFLFLWINLPFIFLWRLLIRPKVPEPEFIATFRFGFILLAYPLTYSLCFVTLNYFYDIKTACLFILGHAAVNLILVKLGITSSDQRK